MKKKINSFLKFYFQSYVPVFMRNCGCKNINPLFSNCSINTLEEFIGRGIRGIGTL